MKIRVLIPLWKRPEVTKLCFDALEDLIVQSKHEISVSCVLSEPEYIPICEERGFNWTFELNKPVGKKINTGIKSTLKYKYDYLMIMNSDDVIKVDLIDKVYEPFFESLNPFFGINKVTYVNFYTHEAREFEYEFSVLGIGKCINKQTVINLNGELYKNDRNQGLDDSMMSNLIHCGIYPTIVKYDGMLAMDFKSEVNIWAYNPMMGIKIPQGSMLQGKIRPGQLDREITFLKPVKTLGESNQSEVLSWVLVDSDPTVWSRKIETQGNEIAIGDQLKYIQKTIFTIRYRTDLNTINRVAFGTTVYEIISITESGEQRKSYLDVVANLIDNEFFFLGPGFSLGFSPGFDS